MNLLLNINQYDYSDFLSSKVDNLIIGLENFCCGYLKTYKIDDINEIAQIVHSYNKKLSISMNIIASEDDIEKLLKSINDIKKLNVDNFVVSDFGVFQILKENGLSSKIIFNPVTNITNKYSASLFNQTGIDHVCLANELNIKDIVEISNYTQGNVEILAQGYYQICNSKRPLLSNFFKNFKIENTSDYYYMKEESRDYAYPIIEVNNEIFVYIDKERCVLNYFEELLNSNIQYLRIDTTFLSLDEIHSHIDIYHNIIMNIDYKEEAIKRISNTNSNLKCLDNISILKKEKGHE